MKPNFEVTIDTQSVNGNTIAGLRFGAAGRRSFEPRKISPHHPRKILHGPSWGGGCQTQVSDFSDETRADARF